MTRAGVRDLGLLESALARTAVFLHLNGYRLVVGADTAERFLIDRVIVAKAELEKIAAWIEKHMRKSG